MGMVPETTFFLCDWPGCTAWFDMDAALFGGRRYPGWVRHPGFMLDLCGRDAGVWGPDRDRHRASGSLGPECGCGARLEPAGPTLGDLSRAYLRHLVQAAATPRTEDS